MQIFYRLILIVILFYLPSCSSTKVSAQPDYKLDILVKNEKGIPLESAFVRVMYFDYSKGEFGSVIGSTDNSGIYAYYGKYSRNLVEYEIRKKGYYRTMTKLSFGNEPLFVQNANLKKGIQKTFVMRDVVKPILIETDMRMEGLKYHRISKKVPELGKEIGMDLFLEDWVAPHGQGKYPDIFVKLEKEIKNGKLIFATGEIRFNNIDDGILEISPNDISEESYLKIPRQAPESGYLNKVILEHPVSENGRKIEAEYLTKIGKLYRLEKDYSQHYSFRRHALSGYYYIRFRGNNDNNGKYAGYFGVIDGPITFLRICDDKVDTAYIELSMFLNPNRENNIEFSAGMQWPQDFGK